MMFTEEERATLRAELLDRASSDVRISAGAITGSAASGHEDRWSDIDLAFAVSDAADIPQLLDDWSAFLYESHGALHYVDLRAGAWIYRAFLLESTLQVDLAFVPSAEFRPLTPAFQIVFGEALELRPFPTPSVSDVIGMALLYALHARSSLARGKYWQAEYMISALRDQTLTLACVRHGLPVAHGRGFDQLPVTVLTRVEASIAANLKADELQRAFQVAVMNLQNEIRESDHALAERLGQALLKLAGGQAHGLRRPPRPHVTQQASGDDRPKRGKLNPEFP